jgi:hypothetical protein
LWRSHLYHVPNQRPKCSREFKSWIPSLSQSTRASSVEKIPFC